MSILEYDYPYGYDYEKDAEMIGLTYNGCFNSYYDGIISYSRTIWSGTSHSTTMNFGQWCEEITKVKEKEYIKAQRETKIDSIL